jgi:hypothetical protein
MPDLTCPSAPGQPGAVLLGIISPDGRVGYLTPSIKIDGEFIETAQRRGQPEKQFRFASPCVEGGCQQWTGARCGVIDSVLAVEDQLEGQLSSPPRCAIRTSCRWFAQSGTAACRVCPLVVTEP